MLDAAPTFGNIHFAYIIKSLSIVTMTKKREFPFVPETSWEEKLKYNLPLLSDQSQKCITAVVAL